MPTRRVRRGRARRDELREQGEARNAGYQKLTDTEKLRTQLDAGHHGRQVDLLFDRLRATGIEFKAREI